MPYIDFDMTCETDIYQEEWIRLFNEQVARYCYGEPVRSEDNGKRRKKKRSRKTTKSSSRKKR